MPLPGKRYSEWDSDDLSHLVDPSDPAEESARLDFKKESALLHQDNNAKDKARYDLLKDIASMANGSGGALLIGVDEDRRSGRPPVAKTICGIPENEVEQLKSTICQLVDTHLQVRPAPLAFRAIRVPEGGDKVVLAVQIDPNTYSLSMVTYNGSNQFWVRRGTDNRLMTTDEIQYRFGEMKTIREDAKQALASIRSDLESDVLVGFSWFIGVPLNRSSDHVPVDISRVREVVTTSEYYSIYRDGHHKSTWAPGSVANDLCPTLNGIGTRRGRSRRILLEIWRDGTLVFAVPSRDGNVSLANGIYEPWCSATYLFHDIQREFWISPIAVVQTGVLRAAGCKLVLPPVLLDDPRPFNSYSVELNAILLPENWSPSPIFRQWATQFANYWGEEQPIACPPWVV